MERLSPLSGQNHRRLFSVYSRLAGWATRWPYSPQVSFWGSYERQQGLLNLAALLALFLAASLSLRAFARIEILWNYHAIGVCRDLPATRGDLYARWALVEPDRLKRARSAYQVALRLSPNTAVYHTAMGMILAQGGQMEAAETELTRAIALDATDGMAYRYLAQFYLAIGRTADAERAQQLAQNLSE